MIFTHVKLIDRLHALGYELHLDGDKVKYRYTLPGDPPADKIRPLLDELRQCKGEVIIQLKFKMEFNRLAEHLRQRDYSPQNMDKLTALSNKTDKAWQEMNYAAFKKGVTEMMTVPGTLKREGRGPVAAKIFSRTLKDHIWVAIDPTFQTDDGIPVYTPEEIQGLKGADPHTIRLIHTCKKEMGGKLVGVSQRGEG